jgi:hypothetical protein
MSRWISTKERLPEENGVYLVTFKGSSHASMCWFLNGKFSIYGEKRTYLISAWMMMPDPYKE